MDVNVREDGEVLMKGKPWKSICFGWFLESEALGFQSNYFWKQPEGANDHAGLVDVWHKT